MVYIFYEVNRTGKIIKNLKPYKISHNNKILTKKQKPKEQPLILKATANSKWILFMK